MKMIRKQTSDQLFVDLEKMKFLAHFRFSDLTVQMKDFRMVIFPSAPEMLLIFH